MHLYYSPIVYGNAGNKDDIQDTLFQSNQQMAKQIRAAMPG